MNNVFSLAVNSQRGRWEKQRAAQIVFSDMEKVLQIGSWLPLDTVHVRIEPFEHESPPLRFRMATHEPADFCFFENVVSTEDFVSSLTGKDHLVSTLTHQLRQQKQRGWGGAENRLLGVPDHLRETFRDVGGRTANIGMPRVKKLARLPLVDTFVK